MKGKGYRSNVAKAVWIVIVHLAAVVAVICAAFVFNDLSDGDPSG